MRPSSRFKVTIGISLLVLLIIGLTFLGSTRVTTHAAGTSLKLSTKSEEAAATPPATCGAWSIIPSPTFTGTGFNFFSGVAPVSATNVWAIGSYSNFSQTLIEHWNGRQWIIIPSPSPGLNYNDLRGVTA